MTGAVLIILILVIAIPVGFLMSMAVVAGFLGEMLRRNVSETHQDSELLIIAESENSTYLKAC